MKLTIKNLQYGDFGNYRCISKNSLGETEGSIRVYGKCVEHILRFIFIFIVVFIVIVRNINTTNIRCLCAYFHHFEHEENDRAKCDEQKGKTLIEEEERNY